MFTKFIAPMLTVGKEAAKKVGAKLVKNGPKIAKAAIALTMAAIFGAILGSDYQQRINKAFNKKHDAETADRLTKECLHKIEEEKERCRAERVRDMEEIKKRINAILARYGESLDTI